MQRIDENPESPIIPAIREVPRTGVIFVMNEAKEAGYEADDPAWTNFGQGQPEAGQMPGAPKRVESVTVNLADHEYSPVPGLWELREAVADYYNDTFRRGMPSKYSAENVAISGGGRAGLTRVAASLGQVHLGHFLPDYTAYEELLGLFRNFVPIPILLDPDRGYDFSLDQLEREILGRGLGALLLSNPCNPTGKLIHGEALRGWVSTARRVDCTLILDEFYSHYVYTGDENGFKEATAAAYVEDVDTDPVVIINGLTKNWRYPGWRVSWTLGPKRVINSLASAGSFLDGGASRPLQRAAIPLLNREHVQAEIAAVQKRFRAKRSMMLSRLTAMGIHIDRPPEGTFYVWGDVSPLPPGIDDGMSFFREALQNQCICVPGEFFDVNPGQRRLGRRSRFKSHVRFSFGPPQETLEAGLDRLEAMIKSYS